MYHTRKPTRLMGFDYRAAGYYFVTICTEQKKCLLGKVIGGDAFSPPAVKLSRIGETVQQAITYMATKNPAYAVDHYVIMPNHVHLIIKLESDQTENGGIPLHSIVGRFKSFTTRVYGQRLWQRSFHDHIIRGEKDYLKIWNYVENNALKWESDCFYVKS